MLFFKTKKNLGERKVYSSQIKYIIKGSYDILTDKSEHVTFVQLMDYFSNVNHVISVVRYWIFESNYKRALVINKKLLDMICALSVGEE